MFTYLSQHQHKPSRVSAEGRGGWRLGAWGGAVLALPDSNASNKTLENCAGKKEGGEGGGGASAMSSKVQKSHCQDG